MQTLLPFEHAASNGVRPFRMQLLKWVGNKQRFAHEIAACFPSQYGTYFEPFLGSGAVLGTLSPHSAVASDVFGPLVELWRTLRDKPERVKAWYAERREPLRRVTKEAQYELVKASFNASPNAADLLFLCRACYGGVVRFRKADGYMSTPCGAHVPISPESFSQRVDEWHRRCRIAEFVECDYSVAISRATAGDLVYCDPPYADSQSILYGAQLFSLAELFEVIADCKSRGVFVALSIDGTKRSGGKTCDVRIPNGLFEQEILLNCGRSMLRRFQMAGQSLEREVVADRLLLTYRIEGT
jgi:DNA adenine methylase